MVLLLTRLPAANQQSQRARSWIAAVLVVGIFWVLTLSFSPQLHELIHPDAEHDDHDCAAGVPMSPVTLFLGGGVVSGSVLPNLISGPAFTFLFSTPGEPREILAQLFTGQRVSGRGPPVSTRGRRPLTSLLLACQ
jgi:hypothetical protein